MIEATPGEAPTDFNRRYVHWLKSWQERLSLGWHEAQFDGATRVNLAQVVERSAPPAVPGNDPPPTVSSFKSVIALKGVILFERRGENGEMSVNGITLDTIREPRLKSLLPDAQLRAPLLRK
jgi:hypothetical protein